MNATGQMNAAVLQRRPPCNSNERADPATTEIYNINKSKGKFGGKRNWAEVLPTDRYHERNKNDCNHESFTEHSVYHLTPFL